MECTRSKRKGEVECSKSSHIQESRKSFYNEGEKGEMKENNLSLTLRDLA